ncbi:MAG: hypothetical protein AB7S26_07025 [Sandaracinaceae bacterium]
MSSRTRWTAALRIGVALPLLCACYRSHLRPGDASVDAEAPSDAEIAFPAPDGGCPLDYLTFDLTILFGPQPLGAGGGIVYVSDRDGTLVESADTDYSDLRWRVVVCAARTAAPYELAIGQEGAPQFIHDLEDDLVGRSISKPAYPLPDDGPSGTLDRQEPDSRFVVHIDPSQTRVISDSPFDNLACAGPAGLRSLCWLRFIEVSSRDTLLGGGIVMTPRERPEPDLVLSARGGNIAHGAFTVHLPDGGMLASLPLTEVRPVDCTLQTPGGSSFGGALPGRLDGWRCAYAGVGRVEDTSSGLARGTFDYLDGPDLHANLLLARLGPAEADGLEASVLVPCCDEPDIALEFGDVEQLDGGGMFAQDAWAQVRASGYDRAFLFMDPGQFIVWGAQPDGTLELASEHSEAYLTQFRGGHHQLHNTWVGAVSTDGDPPWDDGLRLRMVQRRVVE